MQSTGCPKSQKGSTEVRYALLKEHKSHSDPITSKIYPKEPIFWIKQNHVGGLSLNNYLKKIVYNHRSQLTKFSCIYINF